MGVSALILIILAIGVVIGLLMGKKKITAQSHPMYGVYESKLDGSFSNQEPFEREFWDNGVFGGPIFDPVFVNSADCNEGKGLNFNNSMLNYLKIDYENISKKSGLFILKNY
jgi:hypothetical protein